MIKLNECSVHQNINMYTNVIDYIISRRVNHVWLVLFCFLVAGKQNGKQISISFYLSVTLWIVKEAVSQVKDCLLQIE